MEEQGESFHIQAKNLVKNIDNSAELTTIDSELNSVANRHSILFPSGSHCTTDKLLFSKAVIEFSRACPSLFRSLLLAFSKIEDPLSKIATLATVYGMILHSRNNKISGIQRLFSTVALAYGADNRVNIVQVLKMFLNEC